MPNSVNLEHMAIKTQDSWKCNQHIYLDDLGPHPAKPKRCHLYEAGHVKPHRTKNDTINTLADKPRVGGLTVPI